MLPLIISYNYEIVYHRQKERESLKSPSPCCFDRFLVFYISLWHTFLQNPRKNQKSLKSFSQNNFSKQIVKSVTALKISF